MLLCGRYIIKYRDMRVLRKHELDAFLCTAVSPLLHDVETMQEMKVRIRTSSLAVHAPSIVFFVWHLNVHDCSS